MAKQEHPRGDKITVTNEQRAMLKKLRKGKGWSQEEMAMRMGVSNGTISNLESARHPQVFKSTYTEALRVLKAKDDIEDPQHDATFTRIANKLPRLATRELRQVEALIDSMIVDEKIPS